MKDQELIFKILEDQDKNGSMKPGFVMIGLLSKPHLDVFKPGYSMSMDQAFDRGSEDNAANVPEIRLDLMRTEDAFKLVLKAKKIALIDYLPGGLWSRSVTDQKYGPERRLLETRQGNATGNCTRK